MDRSTNDDWKRSIGFPINYNSDQSSDDEFDTDDVIIRHPNRHRSSHFLLADGGDGSEADLLGTTPPRARIRNKEKKRSNLDSDVILTRLAKGNRKSTSDLMTTAREPNSPTSDISERIKKRSSLKNMRMRERDLKMDLSHKGIREPRADSMPSPNPEIAVPTLVESCSRFMSLASRLKSKSRDSSEKSDETVVERKPDEDGLLQSRVYFHDTFSLLIKMGNVDKTCRRTISFEEQVWQNELKDLIWLELQAKIAGRTLEQQDMFLCAQRDIVPTIVQNIIDYRFMNSIQCEGKSASLICYKSEIGTQSSVEDDETPKGNEECQDEESYQIFGCLSFNCLPCTSGIGRALKEVGTLLDSFYNAEALYTSSKAMANQHPLIATQLFNHRIKAMCLWYNVALHMRMRILAVRRLILAIQHKQCTMAKRQLFSHLHDILNNKETTVRFNVSGNPSDSNNSEGSTNSDSSECKRKDNIGEGGQKPEAEEECRRHSDVDKSDATTPELLNPNGTVDTTVSNESGYLSDRGSNPDCGHLRDDYDVYNMGPLKEVIMLRLLKKCEVSPYRDYHYEVLKTQGVRRSMMFINKMRRKILKKVYLTFERLDGEQNEYDESVEETLDDTKDEEMVIRYENAKEIYELKRYGCWSPETLQMRLPSYRSHFLLLNTICMETVHDYLSLRLDTQPKNPSCLTVKQLIHELKEGIDIATEMRSAFVRNIDAALSGHDLHCGAKTDLQRVIATFDNTLDTVVKQYLSYVCTMSSVETVGRACLETEWAFSARLAARMRSAARAAPHTFTDIVCNQLQRLLNRFTDHFTSLMDHETKYPEDSDDVEAKRHFVYSLCREAQNVYASEREMTLQTVQFARVLAQRLKRNPEFLGCRERIFKSLMSIRECIASHAAAIVERTRQISWEEDIAEPLHARLRELLLQLYKLGFELHVALHRFVHSGRVSPRAPPRAPRPASLQAPPRRHVHRPPRPRPDTLYLPAHTATGHAFHKELHRFVNDSSPERPKSTALKRQPHISPPKHNRPKLNRSESIGGEDYDTGVFDDYATSIESSIGEGEELGAGAGAGDVGTEEAGWGVQVSRAIIQFAECWMKFVMERCDRGRGLRPRWASQGLEFLMLACDPHNTKHLSDEEFEELKLVMDACISHVVGSRAPPTPAPHLAAASPRPHARRRGTIPASVGLTTSPPAVPPTPPTPPTEPDPLLNFLLHPDPAYKKRLYEAINQLDQMRNEKLRNSKTVGRIIETGDGDYSYEPKLRQVTFKWQRGLKIGAGTFGKVYTVVNTETGQVLAMKELSIGAGDRRAMQRAANELRVLEGVIHPHLVRYYGCEVHREEMLLFMEVCVEGSLEALLVAAGALPESQVRRYCRQLVAAVRELHARNIAHRDIKSGNIFLTNEGHCLKLGDFGCAVKIRANSTAAGELQGCVGTQAYMAPEVFMKQTGHGRAADIWSLGCVVTEMASGKRPFSEYDSNYQIMFVVGMGRRPTIPSSLSHEGEQFCLACLTHDPEHRPRAADLMHYHFLMVKSDEDYSCEKI